MKLLKIIALSSLSLLALVVGIPFIVARNEDSALTQDLQEVLKRNNLTLESLDCRRGEEMFSRLLFNGIPRGFCSFKATPSDIKNLVNRLNLRLIHTEPPESANNHIEFVLDSTLQNFCLRNLDSQIPEVDTYAYPGGRDLDYFGYLELYYLRSTGTACLGIRYLGSG